ncbi:hypothetical protein [Paenibacillus sp. BC26]|uniref:hypothetical protein n=1 Tax=Paenibacillus sp. BC26 TaxID=1881032 RepID=UPI0008F42C92|nr:hypothetical protein [Paenibacillus sp. BC26]SFS59853.1 hypothetical protein SAMN05428962_1281 [Paenibacillus sp. BC26]
MRREQRGGIGNPLPLRQDGAEAHQAFGASIRDKYRFVRRDQWGRLPLTLREPDFGGDFVPQLPPTILQQIALKLQLLMPLHVQWEAKEREWLTLAQKIIRQAAVQVRQESERKAIANHEASERQIAGSDGTRLDPRNQDRRSERRRAEVRGAGFGADASARTERDRAERTGANSANASQSRSDLSKEEAARAEQVRPDASRAEQTKSEAVKSEQARTEHARTEAARTEQARSDTNLAEEMRTEAASKERAGSARTELRGSDRARDDVRGRTLNEQAEFGQDHRVADLFGDVLDWTETKRMAGRLRALAASPVTGQRSAQKDEGKAAVLLLQIGALLNRYSGTGTSLSPLNRISGSRSPVLKSDDQSEAEVGRVRGELNWQTQKPLWQRDAGGMVWRMSSIGEQHQQPNWMEGAVRVLLGRIGDAGLPLAAALAARDEKAKQARPLVRDRQQAASGTTRTAAIPIAAQQTLEPQTREISNAVLVAGNRQAAADTSKVVPIDGTAPPDAMQLQPFNTAKREQRLNRKPVTMTLRRRLGESDSTNRDLAAERLSMVRRSLKQLHEGQANRADRAAAPMLPNAANQNRSPFQQANTNRTAERRIHPASEFIQRRTAIRLDSPVILPASGKHIRVLQAASARTDSLLTVSVLHEAVRRELRTVHGKLIISEMRRIAPTHILHRDRPMGSRSFSVNRENPKLPAVNSDPVEQPANNTSASGSESSVSNQVIRAKSSRSGAIQRFILPNNTKHQITSTLAADETAAKQINAGPSAKGALTGGAKWGTILFVNRLRLLTVTTPTTPGGVRTERIVNRRLAGNNTTPKSTHIDSARSDDEKMQNKTIDFDRRDKQQIVEAPPLAITGKKQSRMLPNDSEAEGQQEHREPEIVLDRARGTLAERVRQAGDQGLILVQRRSSAASSNEQAPAMSSGLQAPPPAGVSSQRAARNQTRNSTAISELKQLQARVASASKQKFHDGMEIKAASVRGSFVNRARSVRDKALALIQRRLSTQANAITPVLATKQRNIASSPGDSIQQIQRIVQPSEANKASGLEHRVQGQQNSDVRTNAQLKPDSASIPSASDPAVTLVQRRANAASGTDIDSVASGRIIYRSGKLMQSIITQQHNDTNQSAAPKFTGRLVQRRQRNFDPQSGDTSRSILVQRRQAMPVSRESAPTEAINGSLAPQVIHQSKTGITQSGFQPSGQLIQRRAVAQSDVIRDTMVRGQALSTAGSSQAGQQRSSNQAAAPNVSSQRSVLALPGRMLQHRAIAQAPGSIGVGAAATSRISAAQRNAASSNLPAVASIPAIPAPAIAAQQAGNLIQRQIAARPQAASMSFKPASVLVKNQSSSQQSMASTQAPFVQRQADSQPLSKSMNLPAQPTLHYAAKPSNQAEPDFTRSIASPAMQHHASKAAAAAAAAETVRQSFAAMKPPAAPTIDVKQVQQMLMNMPQLQPDAIADKVFKVFEKKMKFEQRRSGY